MNITVNLNDFVKVKLTSYGESFYNEFYTMYGITAPKIIKDDNGYTSFQLWRFIEIFGSKIYMGSKNVIEPLEIIKESE